MTNDKTSRNKTGRKWSRTVIIFFMLCVVGSMLIKIGLLSSSSGTGASAANEHITPASEEWNLIVVNRWNEIPKDYSVTLIELPNGQKVDSRIYPDLQEMFDAAREEGIYLIVGEGYRTTEEQQKILDDKIQDYIAEGYSSTTAQMLAEAWVAVPGTSEHQLGVAVDINADQSKSSNEEVYTWLAENAYSYGFILRYPLEKEYITGTAYEPWHYRYVGKEAAEEIYTDQLCLEEYVQISAVQTEKAPEMELTDILSYD